MAFIAASLVTDSSALPRLYRYRTDDLLTTVAASGYFNAAFAQFKRGDQILVSGDLAGSPFCKLLMITSADGAATVTTVSSA